MTAVLSSARRRGARRAWMRATACLWLGAAGAVAWSQQSPGTTNTAPAPPALTEPGPTSTPRKATGSHPAPSSTTLPPGSTLSGANAGSRNGEVIILPYTGKPEGTPTVATPSSGERSLEAEAAADRAKPVVLDRVAAVINGDVILESDVEEEQRFAVFEPYSVPGGAFTPQQAMDHLISRTLILQQMKEQQISSPPSDEQVNQQIQDLRAHIPACAQYHCESEAGWRTFLAAHGFTEEELFDRWRQRMAILNFIDVRFRAGVRISRMEIEDYYNKNLAPEFAKRGAKPPPLSDVSARIDDVLLQQRVNLLLQDWLKSLRDSGNITILDPAYGQPGEQAASNHGADGEGPQ